jgi:hypothetical protein
MNSTCQEVFLATNHRGEAEAAARGDAPKGQACSPVD